MSTSNRIMILSTLPKWPRNGLKTKDSRFFYGLLNHQTSIQYTYGITSREGSMSMKFLQKVSMRYRMEWEAIPKDVVQNLIASMPRRCTAVVKAKGGHTKY